MLGAAPSGLLRVNRGADTCAFLMQKKAFDRVNHSTLANKVLNRNVPFHIVKFFCFCYTKARVYGTMGYLVINDIPLFKWDQARGTVVIISV